MALLPRVFLRDLQFNALVRVLQPSKKWRDRFAGLEINGPVFDLDDDVVIEFSVQWKKNVVRRASPVILGIAPVQVMVVHERPIEKQSAVWTKRTSNHIGCVGRRPAIG